jgi:hypothetical protein
MLKRFIGANNLQAGGRGNLATWSRLFIHSECVLGKKRVLIIFLIDLCSPVATTCDGLVFLHFQYMDMHGIW